jgi:hypothetical protein
MGDLVMQVGPGRPAYDYSGAAADSERSNLTRSRGCPSRVPREPHDTEARPGPPAEAAFRVRIRFRIRRAAGREGPALAVTDSARTKTRRYSCRCFKSDRGRASESVSVDRDLSPGL